MALGLAIQIHEARRMPGLLDHTQRLLRADDRCKDILPVRYVRIMIVAV